MVHAHVTLPLHPDSTNFAFLEVLQIVQCAQGSRGTDLGFVEVSIHGCECFDKNFSDWHNKFDLFFCTGLDKRFLHLQLGLTIDIEILRQMLNHNNF